MVKKRMNPAQLEILGRNKFYAMHDIHGRFYGYWKTGRFVVCSVYLEWNRWYQIKLINKSVKTEEDAKEVNDELEDGLRIKHELEEAEKE